MGGRALILRTWAVFLTSCLLLSAIAIAMYYGLRVNTWAVMTDELQVARLATSIVEERSLVPTIRGEYYGAHSQLYPLLLAPLYGLLDPIAAARAAHALNALLLVGAAVPAFLLARSVSGTATAGYVAAVLTAVTPWLVLATTLLTENAAYAAFVWAVLLCHCTIVRPSPGRDAAALVGVALAFFARTQLFVVALALPVALVLHEMGLAKPGHRMSEAVRIGLVRAIQGHRVLVVAYLAAIVAGAVLGAGDGLSGVVGNYAVPFEGDLFPDGFWTAAAAHTDQIALGVGVVPVVLTTSWVFTTVLRPRRREAHAFAVLLVVLIPVVIAEATSFDLRFTPGQFIQDRYLVYLVPLFAVGCAAWLTSREQPRTKLASAIGAGAVALLLLPFAPKEDTVIFWAAPGAAFRPAIADTASWLHLSEIAFLQVASAVATAAVVVTAWRLPRAAVVGTATLVAAFGAVQTIVVFERHAEPALMRVAPESRGWIDDAVPDGHTVALVPGGVDGPVDWWEAEFWNKDVERELRVDRGKTPTPFPVRDLSVDRETGRLVGSQPSDYLVMSESETRFGLDAARRLAARSNLRLFHVRRPYRLSWSTSGLTHDGWTSPGRPATLRVFGRTPGRRAVAVTLAASDASPRPMGFIVTAQGTDVRGTVDPGGARPPVEITVCINAGGYADVRIVSNGRAELEDGRTVSVHVERIAVSEPWPCPAS